MLRGHPEEGAVETSSSACGNMNILLVRSCLHRMPGTVEWSLCPDPSKEPCALLYGIHLEQHRGRGTVIGNRNDWVTRCFEDTSGPSWSVCLLRVSTDDVTGWARSGSINSSLSEHILCNNRSL